MNAESPLSTPNEALVSVIIPCYNQSAYLAEAITSALDQSHPDKEVIVIDDGSTDDTAGVASRFRVKYVRQSNAGLSAARNKGIAESSGQFLVFLDADDRLLPGGLAAGLDGFSEHPECAFVYGGFQHIAADGSFLRPQEPPPIEVDLYRALLQYNHIGMHGTVMYRRAVFDAVGGFDTSLRAAEDYDLYLRVARRFPIHRHIHMVAEYRKYASNMSRDAALMLRSVVKVLGRERGHLEGRPELIEAWSQGMTGNREFYLQQLRSQVQEARRARRPATRTWWMLLRWDPRGVLRALAPGPYCQLVRASTTLRNAAIRLRLSRSGTAGRIFATPNPIRIRTGQWDGPVSVTIHWQVRGSKAVEIRVGRPDGPLFSSASGDGQASTGDWVRDGTRFYLQDVSRATPKSARTLAIVTVAIVPE